MVEDKQPVLAVAGHPEHLRGKTAVGGNLTTDDMLLINHEGHRRQRHPRDPVQTILGLARVLITWMISIK